MKRETKIFEKKLVRTRNRIERKGLTMIKKALRDQYRSFIEKAKLYTPDRWIEATEFISEEPIKDYFEKFYQMTAPLALMTYKHLKGEKDETDDLWLGIFQEEMRMYVSRMAGEKITTITGTSKEKIKGIIREVLEQSEVEGLGIEKITGRLVEKVGENLRGNAVARARAIAQTEMIGASSYANKKAADSTGLNYKKFWSHSGLEGVRETHIYNQQYTNKVNGINPDERYPNGVMFPGDPDGEPGEVINCRCTELYEIV